MNREEHLAWAKKRALEYVDQNEAGQAFTSFMSDVQKFDGTPAIFDHDKPVMQALLQVGMSHAMTSNVREMRGWINGWN